MKTRKIAFKVLVLTPIGCVLTSIVFELGWGYDLNWLLIGLGGLGLSAVFIISNVFNYKKFPDIAGKDFLESKHRCRFTATQEETLDKIDKLMQIQFTSTVLTDKQDEHGYRMYRISLTSWNIYLHVKFKGDDFELIIKPDMFSFLPDRARNYQFIEKLKVELESAANNDQ